MMTTDENEDDPVMCSELKTQNTDKLCTGKLSAEDNVNMVAAEETDEETTTTTTMTTMMTTDENEDDPVMCSRKNAFNELSRAYFASLHHDVCEQHQAYVNWKNKTNLRYDG